MIRRKTEGEGATEQASPPTSRTMWGDRYLKRIMANISVRVDNLIVRYNHEDVHCVLTTNVAARAPHDV